MLISIKCGTCEAQKTVTKHNVRFCSEDITQQSRDVTLLFKLTLASA